MDTRAPTDHVWDACFYSAPVSVLRFADSILTRCPRWCRCRRSWQTHTLCRHSWFWDKWRRLCAVSWPPAADSYVVSAPKHTPRTDDAKFTTGREILKSVLNNSITLESQYLALYSSLWANLSCNFFKQFSKTVLRWIPDAYFYILCWDDRTLLQ